MPEKWRRLLVWNSIQRWYGRLNAATMERQLYVFLMWLDWLRARGVELSPDELVERQRGGGFEVLDWVQGFVSEVRGRVSYKASVYTTLRSFFLHNRCELPRDRSFVLRGDVAPVSGCLSVEEFRFILGGCNGLYRAVFLCMAQGGMGEGEIIAWSQSGLGSLRRQLDAGAHPLRIDLPGRKRNRNVKPYFTFVGSEAIGALKEYMGDRPSGSDCIFVNQFEHPLSDKDIWRYWNRNLKRIGLIQEAPNGSGSTRYGGKNPHELRDFFRTRWQKSGADKDVGEFLMGHDIDPLGYNKAMSDADYVRRIYRHAEPWLNILYDDREKISVDSLEEVRSEMEQRIRDLERGNERARKLEMLLEDPDVYQAFVETLQRLKERKT